MIKRITLENWKSHLKTELSFSKGTNVLVGISGSGKTSVMDALCFGLFGTFPLANSKTVKLEEVIMSKPVQREHSTVTVDFSYAGKDFTVERTIKKKGMSEAKLFENGKLIAGPRPTEVNSRVEEVLEVTYELFSRAVYTEQNQVDYFLRLNNQERKEKIDDLLMIKKYENVRSNAVSLQNRFRKELELKKNWAKEQEKRNLELEVLELKKKTIEKEAAKKLAEKEKNALAGQKKLLEENILALKEKEKQHKELAEHAIRTDAEINAKRREMEKLEKALKETPDSKTIAGNARGEKEALEKKLSASRLDLEELRKKSSEAFQEAGLAKEQLSKTDKHLSELLNAHASCPVCRRELDGKMKEKITQEALEEKKALEEKIAALAKQQGTAKEKTAAIQELVSSFETRILEARKKELAALGLEEKAAEKQNASLEIERLEKEKQKTMEKITLLSFDEKSFDEQKRAMIETGEKFRSLEKEARNAEEMIAELLHRTKLAEDELRKTSELRKEVENLSNKTEKLSVFVNALRAAQSELRNSLIESINEAISDIWTNIYPYNDLTNCRVNITPEGNYEILVQEKNRQWRKVEGILSGGERSCAALSIRMAIALVLTQNIGWMILDEPTHNLDKNTVKKLSEFLKNHLPELVEQVFIITHEKEMEKAASATLYFIEREKGEEMPSRPIAQEII
ncbi:MAG: hypothetical protein AAB558_00475 [Patescibacteria group bacterium]